MNIYSIFLFVYIFQNFLCNSTKIGYRMSLNLYMKKSNKVSCNLYTPKNSNQQKYVNYLDDNKSKIIVSLGPAGTGKTLFSCQKAINQLKRKEINKIILTRPVVTVEEEIGFLPGNIIKKMDPWTKPIFDIFLEHFSKTELDLMLSSGKIEICPLAFMRGRTFKDAFILADEMQNSSPVQMKMLTTRIGDNSMLVITGDLNQTDYHHKENGLYDFVKKVEYYNNTELIKIVRFNDEDIERSAIVKKVIEIYNYIKPVEKKVIKTKTTNKMPGTNLYNSDAALMPKHHITHNYDIFIEGREF